MFHRMGNGLRAGLGLVLLLGALALLEADGPTSARPAQDLSGGQWTAIANGDDILALVYRDGLIWAGTRGGGLLRWDAEGNYVQRLAPQQPLPSNNVRALAIDDLGRVWIGTSRGLAVLDDGPTPAIGDDTWLVYTQESTAGGLPSNDLRALAIDGDIVYVGTAQIQNPATGDWEGGGLGRLDTAGTAGIEDDQWSEPVTFEGTRIEAPDGSQTLGLVSDNINALALTSEGNLWVGASPHWLLAPAANPDDPPQWQRVHGGMSYLNTAGTPTVEDDSWRATSCQDVQITVTCHVQALAIDEEDRGWAGIQGRGLLFFDASRDRIPDDISRRFDLPDRRVGDTVEAIAVGPPGESELADTVWIGRSNGGLSVLDHKGTPTIRSDDIWNFDRGYDFTTVDGLARNRVQALAIGSGKAWVGTGPELGRAGGIMPLDLSELTLGDALTTDKAPPTNFITDIDFGQAGSRWEGHVWVATGNRQQPLFGAGVVDIDTRGTDPVADDLWQRYDMRGTDADGQAPWTGLGGDNVQAVMTQGDRVWFGSLETIWNSGRRAYDNGGLAVFDGESWTLRGIENTGGASAGLRDGSISSLARGCEGEIWVGSGNRAEGWGGGVDVLTPGASVHQPGQDGWRHFEFPTLASNNVTDIDVSCEAGEVWVASEHHSTLPDSMGSPGGRLVGGGVVRYDIEEDRWQKFDTRNGLESFASGTVYAEVLSVMAEGDGRAWVGSYGTRAMTQADLVAGWPFLPAPINLGAGDSWEARVFERGGAVRSIARDRQGRVWVGTSRGGAARDSATPDSWREDRDIAGLHVFATPDPASEPISLAPGQSAVMSNDISVVAVAPNGHVWLGTEGWGLLRYDPDGPPPTATPSVGPPNTPTPRPISPTPTGGGEETPTVAPTPTRGATRGTPGTPEIVDLWLPLLQQRRNR